MRTSAYPHRIVSFAMFVLVGACADESTAPVVSSSRVDSAIHPDAVAASASRAELPRVYLQTTMPVGARNVRVPAGTNLQNAINAAVPGDVLVLDPGATYTGNFTLPKKTSDKWIVIRSSGNLPPEGTRVRPSDAPQLAKIVSRSSNPVFTTQNGSGTGFYRLTGLEITGPTTSTYALVRLGSGSETAVSQLAHDIVIDRSYIHGWSQADTYQCIELNSARTAIVDSWIAECHSKISVDGGYAIKSWLSPGPLKIANNYIAASGITILFGGHDPSIASLVGSDIEIRRNYFYKSPSWKGVWPVKNILESKSSQRVLVEGNVLDGSWQDRQDGAGISLKSSNQNGGCTWCVTQDWTLRNNRIRNVGYAALIAANPPGGGGPAIHARRITFANNVMDRMGQNVYQTTASQTGLGFYYGGDVADFVAEHNTIIITGTQVGALRWANRGPMARVVLANNLVTRGQTGVTGCSNNPSGCGPEGANSLNTYAPYAVFAGNAVIGASASAYPARNIFPASLSAVKFVDPASFNWTLAAGSPLKGAATDGTDPGADIAAVSAATRSVEP